MNIIDCLKSHGTIITVAERPGDSPRVEGLNPGLQTPSKHDINTTNFQSVLAWFSYKYIIFETVDSTPVTFGTSTEATWML